MPVAITLDGIDIYYAKYYLPLIKAGNSSAYSSIDKYAQQAAESNSATQTSQTSQTQNTQQTNSTTQTNNVPNDYSTLMELLKLHLPQNKLEILLQMSHSDLVQFLYLLDKDDLLNGLKFFTKEKLKTFVNNLPKEQLLKMLFSMYTSKEQILDLMPIKELNNFLSSKKIEKSNLIKIFQTLSKTELAQIMESITGTAQGNKSQVELLQGLNGLNAMQLTGGIKGLEYKKMLNIVKHLLKQDETLFQEFSQTELFKRTENFTKSSLIEGMNVLGNDQIIKYLDKLPDNLLSVVLTQIDTSAFAQILISDYQNLLSSIFS